MTFKIYIYIWRVFFLLMTFYMNYPYYQILLSFGIYRLKCHLHNRLLFGRLMITESPKLAFRKHFCIVTKNTWRMASTYNWDTWVFPSPHWTLRRYLNVVQTAWTFVCRKEMGCLNVLRSLYCFRTLDDSELNLSWEWV